MSTDTPGDGTVAFSVRHLRADLRDRLHGLQAMIESKTGKRHTMEVLVNVAMARGVEAMEASWFPPAAAAKLRDPNAPTPVHVHVMPDGSVHADKLPGQLQGLKLGSLDSGPAKE